MKKSEEYLSDLYTSLGDFRYDFRNFNLVNMVLSLIQGKKVLDIGCGSGFLLKMLKERGKTIYGVEPNEKLVQFSRKQFGDLNIVKSPAEEIEALDIKVDTVVMMDVLEHIEDDRGQLRKISACLNEDGHLVIVVPAFRFLFGKRDINNGHFRRYSKKELLDKIEGAGFQILKIRFWNALAFLPYFYYEKLLKRELNTDIRTSKEKGFLKRILWHLFNNWFRFVENKVNFGFGLSLVCVAKKIESE